MVGQYRGHETGGHVGLAEHQRHQGETTQRREPRQPLAPGHLWRRCGQRFCRCQGAFIGIVIQPFARRHRAAIERRRGPQDGFARCVGDDYGPASARRSDLQRFVPPCRLRCGGIRFRRCRTVWGHASWAPLAIQDSVGIVRPLLPPRAIIHPARCNSRFPTAAPACHPCPPLGAGHATPRAWRRRDDACG